MTQIIFNSQEEFEEAVMDAVDYKIIQKECSRYFDDSTTYADELATCIFNKLTKRTQAHVMVLKKIAYCADGARQSNSEGNYGYEKEWLRHLYNLVGEYDCTWTPQQHLTTHDAEVAAKAIEEFGNYYENKFRLTPATSGPTVVNEVKLYVEGIRAKIN